MLKLQTLVISLKRTQSRREKVGLELAKTALDWQFLDAIDGALLPLPIADYPEQKVRRLLGFPLTPAELGCFLSHRAAWQQCVTANQVTLIFEDDFVLSPDFENELGLLLEHRHDWDLLRLQGLVDVPYTVIHQIADLQLIKNHGDPLGATAYLLTPSAAKTLVTHAQQIFEPLDHYLEHEKFHGIRMLAIKPYPVWINGLTSTISDRPERQAISGYRKRSRSFWRWLDRLTSHHPWFPK